MNYCCLYRDNNIYIWREQKIRMEKELFRELGFIDAEIEVYKTLLRLGPSVVSTLHQESGLHRTHIYDILEKLREKGLVSVFIQSGKKHFQAASPSRILTYLDEKKVQVKELLPDMEKLMTLPRESTLVELFKGKDGLKTVFHDIIKTKKDYFVMGSIKQFEDILQYAMPSFLKQIESLDIKEKVICDKKEKIIKISSGKYRYLSGKYLFPSSYCIYGDKVAIFIWHLPYFAIVIKNRDVAKTYQNYFDFFWEIAKE